MRHHGPTASRSGGAVSLLPQDNDPRWLPGPIPASFYARSEPPSPNGWAGGAATLPSRHVLAMGAVALAGVVVVGTVAALAFHRPGADAQRIALAPPSAVPTPSTAPSDQPTPFVAAPTDTPTPTPTTSPTPSASPSVTPSPSSATVTIVDSHIQAQQGARATLVAATAPRARCTIAVGYSPAPALSAVTATGSGSVSWTWRVSSQVKTGTYPIVVTCGQATAGATITVTAN